MWLSAFLFAVVQAAAPSAASMRAPTLEFPRAHWVIVDREPGQYLGHPTTVLLEDGATLLCVYPKGHGKGAIQLKRSRDGGASWSERLPTPASWATSLETPTIHRVAKIDGSQRLLVFSGLRPIRLAHSDDDGATWSELEPIGDFGGIVAMASVEPVAKDGWLAFFHDDGRFLGERLQPKDSRAFHVFVTESRDAGATWSDPRVIASHSKAHLCEPGVVRSPDGKQLLVLLRENSRAFHSFFVVSDDEGATWSEPRELALEVTGDRHVARYAADGRLVLSFRDTAPGSSTAGDWMAWVGRYEDLAVGAPGQYRVRLGDNRHAWDCAYPGLERLPDGTFVCTTYGHWDDAAEPYIVSARFKLDEFDAQLQR